MARSEINNTYGPKMQVPFRICCAPGYRELVGLPRIVNIDRIRLTVIAYPDNGTPGGIERTSLAVEIKQDRSTSIDLGSKIGQRKAPDAVIVCSLAKAVSDGITPGLIKELSSVGRIHFRSLPSVADRGHFQIVASHLRRGIAIKHRDSIIIVIGPLTGFHKIANRGSPSMLRPIASSKWIRLIGLELHPIIIDRAPDRPAIHAIVRGNQGIVRIGVSSIGPHVARDCHPVALRRHL